MKKIMTSTLLFCLVALAGMLSSSPANAQTKSETLDKIIDQMNAAEGLRITFDLSMDKQAIRGDYYALGQNFYYNTPQMKAWYNAKDLWVYLDQNDEVNLSTPMKEDLTEINPLLNLNTIKEQKFKITEVKKDGTFTLTATPEKSYKGVIERVVVKADQNYKPLAMTIKEKGMAEMIDVKIISFKRGAFPEMKDKGFFAFTSNKLPGKMVIDLR